VSFPNGYHTTKRTLKESHSGSDYFGGPYYSESFKDVPDLNTFKSGPEKGGSNKHPLDKLYYTGSDRLTGCEPAVVRVTETRPYGDFTHVIYDVGENLPPSSPDISSGLEDVVSKSYTGALNALRNGRTQMGADMAEGKKTVEMVAGSASQLAQGLLAFKRGNFGSIPSILGMSPRDVISGKSFANRWLEYQYGWKPLMGSIFDGIGLLQKGFRTKEMTFRGSSTASDQASKSYTENANYGCYMNCRKVDSYSARTVYKFKVSNAVIDRVDAFGLLNPVSIGWELVPFSFVVDWFVPVGNVLAAITATAGLEFASGWTSVKTESKIRRIRSVDSSQFEGHTGRTEVLSGGLHETSTTTFRRIVHTSFHLPELYGNAHPFSSAHVANAVALIRQLL